MSSIVDHSTLTWEEKYRANTLFRTGKAEDGTPYIPVLLPDNEEYQRLVLMAKGEVPFDNIMLHSEESGTGKTTIIKALRKDLDLEAKYLNISEVGGIDTIRDMLTGYTETRTRNGKIKLVQLDESDGATINFQKALRALMESASGNARFAFTCNYADSLINAIHSRCTKFDMSFSKHKEEMTTKMVKRAKAILKNEGVEYDDEAVFNLVTSNFPDMRRILKALQHLSQSYGKIDSYGVANYSDGDIDELIKLIFALKIKDAMEWYRARGIDPNRLYRPLFRTFPYEVPSEHRAEAMYVIEEYTDRASRSIDREVTFCTLIVRLVSMVRDLRKKG